MCCALCAVFARRSSQAERSIKSTDATLLIRIMSIINIVDALALAALFPYGYAIKEVEYNFNRGFLSAYCVYVVPLAAPHRPSRLSPAFSRSCCWHLNCE